MTTNAPWVRRAQWGENVAANRNPVALLTALGNPMAERASSKKFGALTSSTAGPSDRATFVDSRFAHINEDAGVAVDPVKAILHAQWASGSQSRADRETQPSSPVMIDSPLGGYVLAEYNNERFKPVHELDPRILSSIIADHFGIPSPQWNNWLHIFPGAKLGKRVRVGNYRRYPLAQRAIEVFQAPYMPGSYEGCSGDIDRFADWFLSQSPPRVPLVADWMGPGDENDPVPFSPAPPKQMGKVNSTNASTPLPAQCADGSTSPLPQGCSSGLQQDPKVDGEKRAHVTPGMVAIGLGVGVCVVAIAAHVFK